jgi:hypothetical protein
MKGELQFCPRSSNSAGNPSQANALESARVSSSDRGQRRNPVGGDLSADKLVRKVESSDLSKATIPACMPRCSAIDRGSLTTRQFLKKEPRVNQGPCNVNNEANESSPDFENLSSVKTESKNISTNEIDALSCSYAVLPKQNHIKYLSEVQKLKPEPRFHPASTAITEKKFTDQSLSGSSRLILEEHSITDKKAKQAMMTPEQCPTNTQIANIAKPEPHLRSPTNKISDARPYATSRLTTGSEKSAGQGKAERSRAVPSVRGLQNSTEESLTIANIQRKGSCTKVERCLQPTGDGDGVNTGSCLEYSEKRAKAEPYLRPAAVDDDCVNSIPSSLHEESLTVPTSSNPLTSKQVVKSLNHDGLDKPSAMTAISPALQRQVVKDGSRQRQKNEVKAESSLHPASTNIDGNIGVGPLQHRQYSSVSSGLESLPLPLDRVSPHSTIGTPVVLVEGLAMVNQPLCGPEAVNNDIDNERNYVSQGSTTRLRTSGVQTVHDPQNIVSVDQARPRSQVAVSPSLGKRIREIDNDVDEVARSKQTLRPREQICPLIDNRTNIARVDPRDHGPRATDLSSCAREESNRRMVTTQTASYGSQSPREMENAEDAYAQFERAVESRNGRDRFDFPGQISYVGDPRNEGASLDVLEHADGKDPFPSGNTDGRSSVSPGRAMVQGNDRSMGNEASRKHAERSRGGNERYFNFYDARGRFKFGKDRTPIVFETRDGEDEKWASWSKKQSSSASGQIAGGSLKDQKEDVPYSLPLSDLNADEKDRYRSSQNTQGNAYRLDPLSRNTPKPRAQSSSRSGRHALFEKPEQGYFVEPRANDFDETNRLAHAVGLPVGDSRNLEISPSNIRQQSHLNLREDDCQPREWSDGAVRDRSIDSRADEREVGPSVNRANGHQLANHEPLNDQQDYLPMNANGQQELTEEELLKIPPQYRLSHQRVALLDDHVRKNTPNHEQLRMDLLHEDSQSFIDGTFDCSFETQLQKAVNFEVRAAKKRAGGRRRRKAKSMRQIY